MKKIILFLSLAAAASFWNCNKPENNQTVNSILGDISFVPKYGYQPNSATNEDLRIKTHLEYVEKLLRQKEVSGLMPELRKKRNQLLDLLHQYWTAGIFPRNYDFPGQRVPCFIDKNGNICAVGYLIEKTAGKQVAEKINRQYKYYKLLAINDKSVNNWIAASGLTKKECAMIQPSYGFEPATNYNHIAPAYGISSSLLSATNLSFNTINAIQISKDNNSKTVPVIGLLTGAAQVTLGITQFSKTKYDSFQGLNITNESKNILSLVNIGLGTSTMILSVWNLIADKKQKDKRNTWNVYSFPAPDNKVGLAISFTRKF